MKKLLVILGYSICVFAFLDFACSWVYPKLLSSWYEFSNNLLGALSIGTPIILFFVGSFLIGLGSKEN